MVVTWLFEKKLLNLSSVVTVAVELLVIKVVSTSSLNKLVQVCISCLNVLRKCSVFRPLARSKVLNVKRRIRRHCLCCSMSLLTTTLGQSSIITTFLVTHGMTLEQRSDQTRFYPCQQNSLLIIMYSIVWSECGCTRNANEALM